MPVGYSVQTLKDNAAADAGRLGVRLGRLCIDKNISVAEVAKALRVSRQTVYNWFRGVKSPCKVDRADMVEAYIAEISKQ
jgi:transcriptional regulator with XRE-family HTH domain